MLIIPLFMTIEDDIRSVDDKIDRDYFDLVVNSYRPLFERVRKKAVEHMAAEGLGAIDMGIHVQGGLLLGTDGKFYNKNKKEVELRDLPQIYQAESDYLASCTGLRGHLTPPVHYAMTMALNDLREKVRKSLADSV